MSKWLDGVLATPSEEWAVMLAEDPSVADLIKKEIERLEAELRREPRRRPGRRAGARGGAGVKKAKCRNATLERALAAYRRKLTADQRSFVIGWFAGYETCRRDRRAEEKDQCSG